MHRLTRPIAIAIAASALVATLVQPGGRMTAISAEAASPSTDHLGQYCSTPTDSSTYRWGVVLSVGDTYTMSLESSVVLGLVNSGPNAIHENADYAGFHLATIDTRQPRPGVEILRVIHEARDMDDTESHQRQCWTFRAVAPGTASVTFDSFGGFTFDVMIYP